MSAIHLKKGAKSEWSPRLFFLSERVGKFE